jgi:hypothetical protein
MVEVLDEPKQRIDMGEDPKLTDWKKEPNLRDLKEDLEACKPSHDAQTGKIKRWNDLRNVDGSARPKKVKGRSSVQPKLIRRQAEWRYSALSEPFLGSEKLFEVNPRTFEDDLSANQNELLLNWQFDTKLNKVKFIDEYVRTTVDEGTSIVRLGWIRYTHTEMEEVPEFEHVEVQTEEDMQFLQQAMQIKEENPNEYLNLPEELRAAVDYMEESGVPTVATIVGMIEQEKEVIDENKPTVQIMHPDNVFIDPSCEGDYEKAGFITVSFETTQAELRKDGRYKNLDKVNWSTSNVLSEPDHATTTPNDFERKDELKKKIVAYEYWGYHDIDGDKVLKPIVATWIGNTLIRMEENPFPDGKPPFVVVNYLPKKREVFGEPDAEILEDNQAILGATTRGMIDLLGRSANSQTGYAKGFLDVTNRRRYENGLDYEFNPGSAPQQSIYQHTYPEIPNSALTINQLQNQEAEALSGVKSFAGGVSGDGYGKVAANTRAVLDASAKREMNILRRLAKGMQDIGVKLMAMNALFLDEEEVVRVTNKKFVTVRREDLKGKFDLLVDISTAEVDEQKAQDLGFMLQTMGPNMDPNMSKLILSDIATLKRMPTLAEKILRFEPQPDPMAEKMKELEMKKLEMDIQLIASNIQLNEAKAQETIAKAGKAKVEAENEASGVSHDRDMEKQTGQAKGNQSLEVTKAMLKARKEGESNPDIASAVGYNELSKMLDAPKRSPNPNPIGSSTFDPRQDPAMNPAMNF